MIGLIIIQNAVEHAAHKQLNASQNEQR